MWVQYKVFYIVTAVRSFTQVLHKAEKFGLNGSFSWIQFSLSKFTETREQKVKVFSLFYNNRKWYHPDRYFHAWTKKLTEQISPLEYHIRHLEGSECVQKPNYL